MATGFIFNSTDLKQAIPLLTADIMDTENHHLSVGVSTAPVEGGGFVVDNAIIQPKKITVTYIITNATIKVKTSSYTHALNEVYNIAEQKEQLTVVTKHKTYKNMIITDVNATNTSSSIGAFKVTLQLQEILRAVAITELAVTIADVPPAAKAVPATVAAGETSTKRVSAMKQYSNGSIGLKDYIAKGITAAF